MGDESKEKTAESGAGSSPPPPLSAYATAAIRASASEAYFQQLRVADEDLREPGLEDILSDLRVSTLGDQTAARSHLLTALRLASRAPYADVRKGFGTFVEFVRKETEAVLPDVAPSPSRFVKSSDTVPIDSEDEEIASLFERAFLTVGRVSYVHQILGWHPTYLSHMMDTERGMMRETGPLPRSWRRYLAIMAAARHQCTPLIQEQAAAFVAEGGEPRWLNGLRSVPAKIANLAELNALLAHRPWLITRDHIAALVRGSDSWSVTELVSAMVLLCYHHAQSILYWGMGIEPEVDLRADTGVSGTTTAEATSSKAKAVEAAAGAGGGAKEAGEAKTDAPSDSKREGHVDRSTMMYEEDQLKDRLMADLHKLMGESGSGDSKDVYEAAGTAQLSVESTMLPDEGVSHFCGHPLLYVDFGGGSRILKTQDYCWDDHGYALVSRYFPAAAPLLDEQFSHTYDLTYDTFSQERNIDTMPFRRAIWYYVHRIFGICNDDYDYREVNVFLPRAVKSFVKKVTCYPESVTSEDYDSFSAIFMPSEKCHICLLALEARKQAGLLHGLHAVMQYMT